MSTTTRGRIAEEQELIVPGTRRAAFHGSKGFLPNSADW